MKPLEKRKTFCARKGTLLLVVMDARIQGKRLDVMGNRGRLFCRFGVFSYGDCSLPNQITHSDLLDLEEDTAVPWGHGEFYLYRIAIKVGG